MDTPICNFVNEYLNKNSTRLHVPAHKGNGFLGCEKFDITEIVGADSLYNANGIIFKSQKNASKLFGCDTYYSCEGSSLSIRAMAYLVCLYAKSKNSKPIIVSTRNVHKSFISALALLDINVKWFYTKNQTNYTSLQIDLSSLNKFFIKQKVKPTAFYITSPDYLGDISKIGEIAKICHKHGVLLMVDCAHGAYLKFLSPSLFPTDLGADMCCSSAHKTLPVLTSGAYLHIAKTAPKILRENALDALSLFGSTSPSYLILQSLDYCNKYINSNYKKKLNNIIVCLNEFKKKCSEFGLLNCSVEPLKVTFMPKSIGYLGGEFAKILSQNGFECEFFDNDFVVLMFSQENTTLQIENLYNTIKKIQKRKAIKLSLPKIERCKVKLSIKKALLSKTEVLPIKKCLNKIYAQQNLPCPPAVPLIICGEVITKNTIDLFKYYGIKSCKVVKE